MDGSSPVRASAPEHPANPKKRQKRSSLACIRCHSQKVKCTGGVPCQRCIDSKRASQCRYPLRTRTLILPEETPPQSRSNGSVSRGLTSRQPGSATPQPQSSILPEYRRDSVHAAHDPQRHQAKDQASQRQSAGESTCAAFSDRLLHCLQPQGAATISTEYQYVQHPALARQYGSLDACRLPERMPATLLVRVALRFIGQDYHFFLHRDFLQQLERAYSPTDSWRYDSVWACKFFVVLALGTLYSTATSTSGRVVGQSVPGTAYFLSAVALLQDLYEEPTIAQIETLLLFCFYSNALGRVKSAHVYSGLALRLSTCLGLHRSLEKNSHLTTVEEEHRVRLWWTVYCFDRSTSLRMGQPVSIDDADITIRMPLYTTLPDQLKEIFDCPDHFCANIELSQIEGDIIRNINCLTNSENTESFVNSVRLILTRLRNWDTKLPRKLRLGSRALDRPAASLQLHFNQCIILTTRPILLHVLRFKNPFSISGAASPSSPMSATSTTLAESCISAARTSSKILSQLFVENSLATYGYFDAHNLFSSTLVLIISAIISPNAKDSDAVQMAFHLLKSMRDNGNTAASQYFERLAQIQSTVGRLRAHAGDSHTSAHISANDTTENALVTETTETIGLGHMQFEDYDWSQSFVGGHGSQDFDWAYGGDTSIDPLSDPLLQSFLGHMDGSLDDATRPSN